MRGVRSFALVALLMLGLLALPSTPAPAADRPTGPLALADGAYFGAFENPDRTDGVAGSQAEVTQFEADRPHDRHRQPLLQLEPADTDRRGVLGRRERPYPDGHMGSPGHPPDQVRFARLLDPRTGGAATGPRRTGLPAVLSRDGRRLPAGDRPLTGRTSSTPGAGSTGSFSRRAQPTSYGSGARLPGSSSSRARGRLTTTLGTPTSTGSPPMDTRGIRVVPDRTGAPSSRSSGPSTTGPSRRGSRSCSPRSACRRTPLIPIGRPSGSRPCTTS